MRIEKIWEHFVRLDPTKSDWLGVECEDGSIYHVYKKRGFDKEKFVYTKENKYKVFKKGENNNYDFVKIVDEKELLDFLWDVKAISCF